MLFWNEKANKEVCSKFNACRWKVNINNGNYEIEDAYTKMKEKPSKILRWFPLIPRLQ